MICGSVRLDHKEPQAAFQPQAPLQLPAWPPKRDALGAKVRAPEATMAAKPIKPDKPEKDPLTGVVITDCL